MSDHDTGRRTCCNGGKAKNKSNDASVQGTNDCSILSKHAMCSAGYMKDDFLDVFTLKKAPRRAPLINRGYYVRMKAVESVIRQFLSDDGLKQIISLGAGFDTLFFRLHSDPDLLKTGKLQSVYIMEVDFPHVSERKRRLIHANPVTREFLSKDAFGSIDLLETCCNKIKIATESYCLVGGDLSNIVELEKTFDSCTRLNKNVRTLVLSECVMTYMEHILSTRLIQFINSYFDDSVFVTYEQVKPLDSFGIFMRSHFDKINSRLKAITAYPSIDKQKERYKDCGYNKVVVFTMREFYQSLSPDEKYRISGLEYFDEYEEWHQKCDHYVMVIAQSSDDFKGINCILSPIQNIRDGYNICTQPLSELLCIKTYPGTQQFSHASAVLNLDSEYRLLVAHGGFGDLEGKHTRLQEITAYRINTKGLSMEKIHVNNSDLLPCRLYHTFNVLHDGRIFVFGGRLSPAKPFSDPVVLSFNHNDQGDLVAEQYKLPEQQLVGRWRHAATYYKYDSTEFILITGGITNDKNTHAGKVLKLCQLFDVSSETWSNVSDLPVAIHSHSTCYDGIRYVYLVGGITNNERVLDECFRIDVTTPHSLWERVEVDISAVYSHNLHFISDQILTVGGIGAQGQQMGVQVYSLNTTKKQDFDLPVLCEGELCMYFNHESHIIKSDDGARLIVTGGGGNCFSFGTHINKFIVVFDLTHSLT